MSEIEEQIAKTRIAIPTKNPSIHGRSAGWCPRPSRYRGTRE
jgi:hypothetical protein